MGLEALRYEQCRWVTLSVMEHGADSQSLTRTAFQATVHCLTGCAMGEVLGLVIATWAAITERMTRSVALVLVVLISAAGCFGFQDAPRSVVTTNDDGLRVFSWVSEWQGSIRDCGIPMDGGGVRGRLEGSAADPLEPVWLRADDGRKLSVVWPAGFAVSFDPDAVLYNERGLRVAAAGDSVGLPDVPVDSAAGSYDDPYIAESRVFEGCYAFVG